MTKMNGISWIGLKRKYIDMLGFFLAQNERDLLEWTEKMKAKITRLCEIVIGDFLEWK